MMYDFRCEECGESFEHWFNSSEKVDSIPCETDGCGGTAKLYWEFRKLHSYSGLTQPLVVWKRPDGTYAIPAQSDAVKPPEYERVELRDAHSVRRVEREIGREHYEKWERAQIGKQMQDEIVTSHNRRELRSVMQQGGYIVGKDGERRFVPPMSAAQRDFARFAMQQNDNKPREKYQGAFFFDALSRDASNREDGRNRDGGRVRK